MDTEETVRAVRIGPVVGLLVQLALLAGLARTVGLTPLGWLAGLGCGLAVAGLLDHGLRRTALPRLGPASRLTSLRAGLVGGVAALAVGHPVRLRTLIGLTVLALLLDAADGWTARRTGTVSALGARFDMEVDAFLILLLSGLAVHTVGGWVLAIGLARYALWLAERPIDWLRQPVPVRYWRKVVAATQGVVLTAVVSGLLPVPVAIGVTTISLLLLAESFGHQVWWLARHRPRRQPADRLLELVGQS